MKAFGSMAMSPIRPLRHAGDKVSPKARRLKLIQECLGNNLTALRGENERSSHNECRHERIQTWNSANRKRPACQES